MDYTQTDIGYVWITHRLTLVMYGLQLVIIKLRLAPESGVSQWTRYDIFIAVYHTKSVVIIID